MNLENAVKSTVEFLREFGNLSNPSKEPNFNEQIHNKNFDPNRGRYAGLSYGEMMDWAGPVFVDRLPNIYHEFNPLKELEKKDFEQRIINSIPDSDEFAVVDIGSYLGKFFTLPFARKHPKIQIYMIDKTDIDTLLSDESIFKDEDGFEGLKPRVEISMNSEDYVNRLLNANDFKNVKYINKKLGYSREDFTNLPELEPVLKNKRVIFTGWKNPGNVGYVTNNEARYHGAEFVFSCLTALESSTPDDPTITNMACAVGNSVSDKEFKKIISLLASPGKNGEKYNYSNLNHKYFSIALKQLVNLGACSNLENFSFSTELFLDDSVKSRGFEHHNQDNHLIYAYKKDNILKL